MLHVVLAEHAEEISELDGVLFDNALNEHTIRKEIKAGWGYVWVENGKVAGYALVRSQEGLSDLTRLGVHPDYQGRGIGQALLKIVLEGGPVMLFVRKNNPGAICLYLRYGFEVKGETDASWLMRRSSS
jgi:ribosomal-protein-alanine N-acetyltransferase